MITISKLQGFKTKNYKGTVYNAFRVSIPPKMIDMCTWKKGDEILIQAFNLKNQPGWQIRITKFKKLTLPRLKA